MFDVYSFLIAGACIAACAGLVWVIRAPAMSGEEIFGLVLSVAVLVYLLWVLFSEGSST